MKILHNVLVETRMERLFINNIQQDMTPVLLLLHMMQHPRKKGLCS